MCDKFVYFWRTSTLHSYAECGIGTGIQQFCVRLFVRLSFMLLYCVKGETVQKGDSMKRAYALPSDRDIFLLELHRRGITCRLTFDGCPQSLTSRDTSRPMFMAAYCC